MIKSRNLKSEEGLRYATELGPVTSTSCPVELARRLTLLRACNDELEEDDIKKIVCIFVMCMCMCVHISIYVLYALCVDI